MIFAAVYKHGVTPFIEAKANGSFSCPVIFYLILFVVVMIIGTIFYSPIRDKIFKRNNESKKKKKK
jgi:hypothetical protein